MDLPAALAALPEAYACALRLQLAGATDDAIAAQLDMAPDEVAPLLRLARAKLVTLLSTDAPSPNGG
ncbi:MAG TPA: hypothetical protein VE575_02210 [Acidimicrobiales bacterium]|nr:hypothetical protein [Acidimicrobiales bacterium]